jgi:hypothetical protein
MALSVKHSSQNQQPAKFNRRNEMSKHEMIPTYSGKWLSGIFPTQDDIDIHDIARGLALKCRFSGQINDFYSVAQHSIWVAQKVRDMHGSLSEQRTALLHDAAEAYVGDVPRPYKNHLPDFKVMEDRILCAILDKFHVDREMTPLIQYCDRLACFVEAKWMHPHPVEEWPDWDPKWAPAVNACPQVKSEGIFGLEEQFLQCARALDIHVA